MTIGAALGTIIATIMTAHIRKVSGQSAHRAGRVERTRAPKPPRSCGVIGIRRRYSQASAVSAASATHNRIRSLRGSAGASVIGSGAGEIFIGSPTDAVSVDAVAPASGAEVLIVAATGSAVGPVDGGEVSV